MIYHWLGISGPDDSLRLSNLVIDLSIHIRKASAIAVMLFCLLDSDINGSYHSIPDSEQVFLSFMRSE